MKKTPLTLALSAALSASPVAADYELGVGLQHYGEANRHGSFKDNYAVSGRAGNLDDGVYLWASYEAPKLTQLGQPFMRSVKTPGVGVGVRIPLGDYRNRLSAFAELGYYFPKGEERHPEVTEEVIRESLRKDFDGAPYGDDILTNYDSWKYEYKGAAGGRVGLAYELSDRWSVEASYRFLKITQVIDIWKSGGTGKYPEDYNNCNPDNNYVGGCLWQERNQMDASGFGLSLTFRF